MSPPPVGPGRSWSMCRRTCSSRWAPITGRTDAFSPGSKKIHIDIDPSSINKNIRVDVPIIGDVGNVLGDLLQVFKAEAKKPDIKPWWNEIANGGRATRWPTRRTTR